MFGKLSWQPAQNQLVDFSGNYRKEHETRDFGGQTSFESASDVKNSVSGATLRHSWNNDKALNQATLSLQSYVFNPTALNPDLVGRNYEGVIRIGGRDTSQKFDQQRLELRDDYNFPTFQAGGDHSLQVGGNLDFLRYKVNKSQTGNPVYNFRNDPANGFTFDSALRGAVRLRQSEPVGQQPGVRHLRPGHLDRQPAADGEPRPALGL